MSKRMFLKALDLVREGKVEQALELVRQLDRGFVQRRLRHYISQPDQREAANRLDTAVRALRAQQAVPVATPPEPVTLQGPLPPAAVDAAPEGAIGFDEPEPFLAWASADWDRVPQLCLDRVRYTDVWTLVALGSLGLAERMRHPPINLSGESSAARFARALGLDDLMRDNGPILREGEAGRTVPLTRVRKPEEIKPTAEQMATLIVGDDGSYDMRLAVRHVLIELLRNVVQHSKDPLGAVAAAQRMGPAQRREQPMIQLAVADAGIGIPQSLHQFHPHLQDYRQALERALLPHMSGMFPEGQTGSFENAGLGLYMISEMARQTGGRLLIATTGAALVLQQREGGQPATPRFLQPPGTGFPGTLVAVEIPTDLVVDYFALIKAISRKAEERTPKRAAGRWLTFEAASESAERIPLFSVQEETLVAMELARTQILPALMQRRPVELDFQGIDLCTQSWLHALLFEAVRLAWALRVPIHIVHADPAVREGLRFLEAYALGG